MTITEMYPNPQRQIECGTCGGPRQTRGGREDCVHDHGHLKDRVRWAANMHQDLVERGWDKAHLPGPGDILAAMVVAHTSAGRELESPGDPFMVIDGQTVGRIEP